MESKNGYLIPSSRPASSKLEPFIEFREVVRVAIDYHECHRLSNSVFHRLVIANNNNKKGTGGGPKMK